MGNNQAILKKGANYLFSSEIKETPDCLVIPHSGRVFAQVVSSDLCSKWNGLHDMVQDFIV